VLGASLSLAADEPSLTEAYGHFQEEAQQIAPHYTPDTVNTDGWLPTQKAWQALFATVTLIQCFLHAFLKIRNRTKKRYREIYAEIQQQVWDIYQAVDKSAFWQQIVGFQLWSKQHLSGSALDAVEKLCAKADSFALTFDYPQAYRTSNMIDRHMIPLDRWLFAARYFHGNWKSAEYQIRSWALFHDFMPYCPRAKIRDNFISPVHKLNGFVYHDNWLHNLLISTSCTGLMTNHRKS
jgi:hypothetical protein